MTEVLSAAAILAVIVGWTAAALYLGYRTLEAVFDQNVRAALAWGLALFVLLSVSFGLALNIKARVKATGPCLRYEAGIQYNPATRTMMPYRYCTERGEWIDD